MYLKTQIENLLRLAQEQESYEPYYEVLEYIETDGTQYYKTGEILSSTSKVECRAAVLGAATPTGSAYIFGAYGASKNFGINKASSTGCFCVWGSNSTVFTPALDLDTFYDISLSSDGLYVDGSKVLTPSGTFTGVSEAYISWANGTSQPVAKIKLACLKTYQSGVLTKDYIPVLDNQMRPCLYDKISKTFLYHTNSEGSTSPSFKRWNKFDVDYIQNDTNSYIKTGVNDGEETLSYEADFTYFSGSGYQYVLGAYGGDSYKNTVLYINSSNSIGAWVNKGYSQPAMLPDIVAPDARIKCYADTTKSIINGNTSTTFVDGVARAGSEIYVFRRNGYNATSAQTTSNAIIGLHSLKFYLGGNLIRDYKPVVWHNSDTTAVACLYDEVYNKMYTNAGTGSFKAYIAPEKTYNLMLSDINVHGYSISDNGSRQTQAQSDYTNEIAVKQGDIVTMTFDSASTSAQKRLHGYSGTSLSDWVRLLGKIDYSQTGDRVRSLTVTIPSGISYIRVSHSVLGETSSSLSITTPYEVGKSITSDGTAYIDTGYAFTGDFEWEMIFNGDAIVSVSDGKTLYGGRTSTSRTALFYKIPSSNNYSMPIAGLNGTGTPLQLGTITGKARVWESVSPTTRKASTRVNDVAKQTNEDITGSVGIITGTTQIIFADNYGNQVKENANATLFALTMKDCGELVRSYICVKNATTNAVGVYDYVNKTFTGNSNNSGTLTFNALS